MKALLLRSESSRPLADGAADGFDPAEGARCLANLRWLRQGGCDDVVVAAPRAAGEALRGILAEAEPAARVVAVPNHVGSAAAVREVAAQAPIEAPIVVVEAAEVLAFDLERLLAEHRRSPALATVACRHLRRDEPRLAEARLLEVDRAGRVVRIVRAAVDPSPDRLPVGVAVIEPALIEQIPAASAEFGILEDLLPQMLRRGVILGAFDAGWPVFGPEPSAEDRQRCATTRS